MDGNHQDKTESKLTAIEDVTWVRHKKNGIWMPESKGKRRQRKSLDKFFKLWSTPLTILISVGGLILGMYYFSAQQAANTSMTLQQEAANQAQQLDQQRQATLDTYLDRMSDLLLTSHLAAHKSGDEVPALAQARTYAAVRNLDGPRKGTLVRFLFEAKLIGYVDTNGSVQQPIISLKGADLSGAVFTDAILSGANLREANLSGANLSGADLYGVDFTGANLSKADLLYTILGNVQINGADLSGAYVYWNSWAKYSLGSCGECGQSFGSYDYLHNAVLGAITDNVHLYNGSRDDDNGLVDADLSGAPLEGADLSEANLHGANLSRADLHGANLGWADLGEANLSEADLGDAENLTQQQLDKAYSCLGAILPSGLTCHQTHHQTPYLIDMLKYLAALAFAACIGYFVWMRGLPLLGSGRWLNYLREHSKREI